MTDPSSATEDYLKVIWNAGEWTDDELTTGDLAVRLGLSPSSVSEMIKRLTDQGLVEHAPYGSINLTEEGRRLAIKMVRRHRLLETFLHTHLGYAWDEVHSEAEVLEHAISDRLTDRLDHLLGRPTLDPHGDPIPSAEGTLPNQNAILLADAEEGTTWLVARVSDVEPDILRYLADRQVGLGSELSIVERSDAAGVVTVQLGDRTLELGTPVARAIWVTALRS